MPHERFVPTSSSPRARKAISERDDRVHELEQLRLALARLVGNDLTPPVPALTASVRLLKQWQASALDQESHAAIDAVVEAAAVVERVSNDVLEAATSRTLSPTLW